MTDAGSPDDGGFDRRTYLAALATTTAAGLAGCNGGGGNDNSSSSSGGSGGGSSSSNSGGGGAELGERVPSLNGAAYAGIAGSASIEQGMNQIKKQLKDVLGVPSKVSSKTLTTLWQEAYSDSRSFSYHLDIHTAGAYFLEPKNVLGPHVIQNAGANGKPNTDNYASCAFSKKVMAQETAPDPKTRHKLVHDATAIASKDVTPISLCTVTQAGASRTDQVQITDVGKAGVSAQNSQFLWNTKPVNGTKALNLDVTPDNIAHAVHMLAPAIPWIGTVYFPLVIYDKNYELKPGLATDWKVSNGYKTFTFDLHPDATFSNGDPITAEDVKWTFNFLEEHGSAYPLIPSYPYDSIETPDDHTVVVNMKSPQPSWISAFVTGYGAVLPKKVWLDAGAEKNPKNPNFDHIVASGPYEVKTFKPHQLLSLTARDDHVVQPQGDLNMRGYQNRQDANRAFERGELNLLKNITGDTAKQLQNKLGGKVKVARVETAFHWFLETQHSFAPTMFREFRMALSQALDRTLLNQILTSGHGETMQYSSWFSKTHPWFPDSTDSLTKIADSPKANQDAAKKVLTDAGWGWDDNGRLHYPKGKDLTPAWPKGSTPCKTPDNFPCLPDICKQ